MSNYLTVAICLFALVGVLIISRPLK